MALWDSFLLESSKITKILSHLWIIDQLEHGNTEQKDFQVTPHPEGLAKSLFYTS